MVRKHQASDAQLRIGESRDSGFDIRPRVYPSSANMTVQVGNSRLGRASPRNDVVSQGLLRPGAVVPGQLAQDLKRKIRLSFQRVGADCHRANADRAKG